MSDLAGNPEFIVYATVFAVFVIIGVVVVCGATAFAVGELLAWRRRRIYRNHPVTPAPHPTTTKGQA